MNSDAPPLHLSDIIHTLSPSPVPSVPPPHPIQNLGEDVDVGGVGRQDENLGVPEEMQASSSSLRPSPQPHPRSSSSSPPPSPSQLLRQAQTISQLTHQRNLLLTQAEEERERWAAERLGWQRMAEALIAARKGENVTYREEELAQQISFIESEKKSLQHKKPKPASQPSNPNFHPSAPSSSPHPSPQPPPPNPEKHQGSKNHPPSQTTIPMVPRSRRRGRVRVGSIIVGMAIKF
ncbi:hypothetical protein JAAARDRAFT_214613 [Jaapia argillacea MUCL 33604]|uniref:Uncharacterized protein n=1 Tax=Jaapia argillacea MUCL 33604 TaxID=933084 RepID=A0A067QCW6_9AGAM|nr:hypothetical protein JAAARDRAFT_214613 [Jaapia argillacea MUCL 33604]